jgi:hypothetical protein
MPVAQHPPLSLRWSVMLCGTTGMRHVVSWRLIRLWLITITNEYKTGSLIGSHNNTHVLMLYLLFGFLCRKWATSESSKESCMICFFFAFIIRCYDRNVLVGLSVCESAINFCFNVWIHFASLLYVTSSMVQVGVLWEEQVWSFWSNLC